jgi:ABC-type uncharacterized transport system auxiliary subunit
MILYPDTVVDPGAMMVKALNALIADTAMTRSLGSNNLAVRTEQNRVKILEHSQERNVIGLLKVPRVRARC